MLKRFFMAVGLLAALQTSARAGEFAFEFPVHVRWSNGALAVTVADFNGDKRDDMAVLAGGELHVVLQDGTGGFATPLKFKMDSVDLFAVGHADIGADGTNEILVGYDKGLAVYKWNGAGFSLDNHPSSYPCWFMATADLNLDGSTDVLCHGFNGDATLYYSAPGKVLELPVFMQTGAYDYTGSGATYMQAQLEDVTGDGKPDLLLAAGPSSSFFVHAHDGGQGFLPAVAYTYPAEYALYSGAIEVADLDDDGSNEVIVGMPCNTPCSNILIYKQGAGSYLKLSRTLSTYDNPMALLASDIDKDGKQDLLVGHAGWRVIGMYMGQAQDLSDNERLFLAEADVGSNRYSLGDLDHDGYTDLAIANTYGVSVLYGRRRAVNDFNGDFVSDVMWRRAVGTNAIWLSADSAKPQSINAADPAWSIQATGDFDGNGVSEMFWRNRMTGANQLWESGYDPKSITAVTTQEWQVVGAGDFDGDDISDLLWRNLRSGANAIWKSGNYKQQQAIRAVTDINWQIVGVGDFNGDGRSDILWRHAISGVNAIWLSGRFETQQAITGVTSRQWRVQGIGDFNGDGKDDVVWRSLGTGMNAIWLSADFRTQQDVVAVTSLDWTIAAVADYNGDGRSDLLWRNGRTGVNVIWRSANFSYQQTVATVNPLWQVIR